MVKYKSWVREYRAMNRTVWMLAWPAIIEFGLQTVVQYADILMVGGLGKQATATVGIATQLSFFIKFPIANISIGVLAYISKAMGEKSYENVRKASMQCVFISIAFGLFGTIVALGIGPFLPEFLNIEKGIRSEFMQYYCIIYSTLLLFTVGTIFSAVLRAAGDMKTPMIVNGLINIMNILLNALFIYPSRTIDMFHQSVRVFGFGLGINGSAVATAISIGAGSIVMFVKVYKNPMVTMKNTDWSLDKKVISDIVRIGAPASLSSLVNGFGRLIFTSYVSGIGTFAIAAHSIAFTIEGFFYIPAIGFERAVAVITGNYLGERNKKKIMSAAGTTAFMGGVVMLVLGSILFIFAPRLTSAFTSDQHVAVISSRLLRIVAFSEPIFALSLIIEGVFQGLGNTRTPFWITTISMWSIRVVLCYILTQQLSMGITTVWICMVADNVCRAVVLSKAFIRQKWEKLIIPFRRQINAS